MAQGSTSIGDTEPPSTGGSLAALSAVMLAVGIAGMILTAYHNTSADLLISRVLQATRIRGIEFRLFGKKADGIDVSFEDGVLAVQVRVG